MSQREPVRRCVEVDGLELVAWEWAPEGAPLGPPVLLVHGIGLHGRTWDRVIRALPASAWVFALDLSGHGASANPPLPAGGQVWWDAYGREIAAVASALDLPPALGVGHSMSGHSMIFAAEAAPERFCSLLLFDPTVGDPERAAVAEETPDEPRPVSRRRNEWASPDEMFERFRSRAPFDAWDEDVLRDYCTHGLVRSGDGFVLACPPAFEGTIWGGMSPDVYRAIASIEAPVHIVRAEPRTDDDPPGWTPSQTWPGVYEHFAQGTDELAAGLGHFFALEAPDLGARLIEQALRRAPAR
ncbi:MAG: alpha/beta fold hydrolase [Dehalococcoidia bacterium]